MESGWELWDGGIKLGNCFRLEEGVNKYIGAGFLKREGSGKILGN